MGRQRGFFIMTYLGLQSPTITSLYGDELEVGSEAVVAIETSKGLRHVGGAYDPVFEAPPAVHEEIAEGASAFLAALFEGLFSRSSQTVYATSRGSQSCATATDQAVEPIAPLDRLRRTDQEIGSDIQVIVAAWKYSEKIHAVRAILRDRTGIAIVSAATCRSSHLSLPLKSSNLSPGDRLTLEIDNGEGGAAELSYSCCRA